MRPIQSLVLAFITCWMPLSGCTPIGSNTANLLSAVEFREFIPINPIDPGPVTVIGDDGEQTSVHWTSLPSPARLALLPNQLGSVAIYKQSTEGEIRYLASTASAGKGNYYVIMDYAIYMTRPLKDLSADKVLGQVRVGSGLRIKAQVTTFDANVDLGSLIAIGAAVKLNQARGRLQVEAIGMNAPEIRALFPTPYTIDETSIQLAIESIVKLKDLLDDESTIVIPQVLHVRVSDMEGLRESDMSNEIGFN